MGKGGTRCAARREIGLMIRLRVAQQQEFRTFPTKLFVITIQLVTDLFPHYAMQCFTMKNADGAMPDTFFALRQIILDHGTHRPCALAPAVGASNQNGGVSPMAGRALGMEHVDADVNTQRRPPWPRKPASSSSCSPVAPTTSCRPSPSRSPVAASPPASRSASSSPAPR